MLFSPSQLKAVFRQFLVICGVILLSRLTKNWGMLLLAAYGIYCSLTRKDGKAMIVYLLLSFLPMVNPLIMPRYSHFAAIARLSSFAMTFALILGGTTRRGNHAIPLGGLFIYLVIAFISSTQGYFPLMSFLKIINFLIFLLGIYVGTRNIHHSPRDIQLLRNTFLALSAFLAYGSLLTLPFPSVAYLTSAARFINEFGYSYANSFLATSGQKLFCGATAHSQFLGPMIAGVFGWLLCDMFLVEKKFSCLHLFLLLPIPVIAFMTRSRIALLTLLVAAVTSAFFCLNRSVLNRKAMRKFKIAAFLVFTLMILFGITQEVRHGTISKWLRKTNELQDDDRTLGDAVTASRQSLIYQNMVDFKRNIMLGSGFQVDANTRRSYKEGRASLFSASIEKGILPLMVLGETGIIGGAVFALFLASFFAICSQKKYKASTTMFIVFLTTNMAEATFFSPAGAGGTFWIYLVAGGFVIDMTRFGAVQITPETYLDDSYEFPEDDEEESPDDIPSDVPLIKPEGSADFTTND